MISRLLSWRTRLRRLFSRVWWARPLLGPHHADDNADEAGLILIQIDGLSFQELQRALAEKRMPFLQRLLRRENYGLRRHYSGMPSTTPAVQGELFYGVRAAVPAFSFRDSETGHLISMLENSSAAKVEERIAKGRGLLAEGSGYSNIYAGGAAESHFCAATMGWNAPDKLSALRLAVLIVLNAYVVFRMAALGLLELVIAVYDLVTGTQEGHNFTRELKFIPLRVIISILLREIITFGARVDAARGLPVIHTNFLGYDEQAHRRGPDSAFAHWTLQGIDDAVKRIWFESRRSNRRDYDVWVYSDHGHEHTEQYAVRLGRSVHDAVADVLGEYAGPAAGVDAAASERGMMLERINWLGSERLSRWLARLEPAVQPPHSWIAAKGPVGHVYPPVNVPPTEVPRIARELVEQAGIPLVAVAGPQRSVRAWNAQGEWRLPDDARELLGANHPFLEETAADLVDVVRHRDAGTFVLFGWEPNRQPLTFAAENGAHGGPGPAETSGFLLAPLSDRLPGPENSLRPEVMRTAALRILHRSGQHLHLRRRRQVAQKRVLRLMTYNVHSCRGLDGRYSVQRIARAVADYAPDVLCLQEVDVQHRRSGFRDQAERLGEALEMEFLFHPVLTSGTQFYGDAILSHLPLRQVKVDFLPGVAGLEVRGALWAEVLVGEAPVQVINTHLGLTQRERRLQVDALLGEEWLGHPFCTRPAILCGDFNLRPGSAPFARLCAGLRDVEDPGFAARERAKTWPSEYPFLRLDHIFVTDDINVLSIEVPRTELTRMASDHLPLLASLQVPPLPVANGQDTENDV